MTDWKKIEPLTRETWQKAIDALAEPRKNHTGPVYWVHQSHYDWLVELGVDVSGFGIYTKIPEEECDAN